MKFRHFQYFTFFFLANVDMTPLNRTGICNCLLWQSIRARPTLGCDMQYSCIRMNTGWTASQTCINEPDCCAGQRTAEKLHGRRDNLRHFRRISNVIHCHLRHSDYVLMCFHWCGSFHLYVGYIDFPCWPFSWPRVILEFFFRSMRLIRCRDSLLRKSAYLCLFSNSLVLQGPVLSSRCLVWEAYSLRHYHLGTFPFLI